MPEAVASPTTYQLRVVLRGISPLIWRRLLVRADSSIADLHYTLQIAFAWTDSHLHCFRIHGQDYGVHQDGGPWFDRDAKEVLLRDFQFRGRERFQYNYDFTDHWVHEIRVEQILTGVPKRSPPVCLAGQRSAPPEECGGVRLFLERRQEAPWRAQQLLDEIAECVRQQDVAALEDCLAQVPMHQRWLTLDQFDRRRVNERLQQ